jgi:predicted CXXCH cytochrome family protein
MRQPARHGPVFRTVAFLAGSGLAMVFLLLASCDEIERHKVLTFFFDGVPPLQTETSRAQLSTLKDGKAADNTQAVGWHIHPPVKNCTVCHGEERRTAISGKVQLVAEVPQLCYKCHREFSTLESWVHGPVATGDCLLCHEPHKTKAEFLLKKPVPDLCFQCHDVQAVRSTKNHAEASYSSCTDCHDGHAGATKSLLRQTFLEKPAGLEYQSEIHRRKYEEASRRAKGDLAQGQDFLAFSGTIIDYIQSGQLWPARAYIEVLLNSNLITDVEKPLVSEVLQQVIALQTSSPVEPPQGTNTQVSPSNAKEILVTALQVIRDQRSEQARKVAELYYQSIRQYRDRQLLEAREGFRQVLNAGSTPAPMKETAQTYLKQIEQALTQKQEEAGWHLLK